MMDRSEIDHLIEQALDALRRGEDVRALAITDQLTAAVPDDPLVRAVCAQALLGAADPDEALGEARRAVELDPQSEFARRLLGLAAWRAEKLSLAQESLERAVELSGRSPRMLADYAWFMAQERGPRLAEQCARAAVEADAASSTAWAALGLVQYRLNRRGEAEASLRRALQLDPNDIYAQSAMAVLLQEQGRDAQAVALADLLKEQPGTEELVAAVRDEAKKRKIDQMLVERQAMPGPPDRDSRRGAMWLVMAVVMIAGLCVACVSDPLTAVVICAVLAMVPLWFVRRMFD